MMIPPDLEPGDIPGAFSISRNQFGDNVQCIVHGPKFTAASVRIGYDKVIAVCQECFLADAKLKEPGIADVICRHDDCHEPCGDNWCRLCKQRYCVKHMFLAGHGGTCVGCMAVDVSGITGYVDDEPPPPKVKSLEDTPCAKGGGCEYHAFFFCSQCNKFYCKIHISSMYEAMCTECSGEEDETEGSD